MAAYESKSEYELAYWRLNGLKAGTRKYKWYLAHFGFVPDDFIGKVVADVGCGPFGGVLSVIKPARAVAVDPLFEQFEKEGLLKLRPGTVRVDRASAYVGHSDDIPLCHYIFSCNALDHSLVENEDHTDKSVAGMLSKLLPGGELCLWVHLKTFQQLDFGHDVALTLTRLRHLLRDRPLRCVKVFPFDPVNRSRCSTLMVRVVNSTEPAGFEMTKYLWDCIQTGGMTGA